jgi:histone-lysine N-methyltransferase SETD3
VEFKDIQRGIVSSILTSCYAGVKLVEYEWSKCMGEDKLG